MYVVQEPKAGDYEASGGQAREIIVRTVSLYLPTLAVRVC